VELCNLARSGALVRDVASEQLPRALSVRPALASVLVGVNDTLRGKFDPGAIAADLENIVAALQHAGTVVLTASLPDPGLLLRIPASIRRPLARRAHEINTALGQLRPRPRRRSGSLPATAAITALNRAPRSRPIAAMTASLSTPGDGQAAPGWRSSQLSALVGVDPDPAGPDPDRHRFGLAGRLPGSQPRREGPDRQRDGRLQGGQAAQEGVDEPGG
jgi:GDSL-like Lipase/Acylhydrolase family